MRAWPGVVCDGNCQAGGTKGLTGSWVGSVCCLRMLQQGSMRAQIRTRPPLYLSRGISFAPGMASGKGTCGFCKGVLTARTRVWWLTGGRSCSSST